MENNNGDENVIVYEIDAGMKRNLMIRNDKSDMTKESECYDFSVAVDSSKAAKLRRALKWAGLKLVSFGR